MLSSARQLVGSQARVGVLAVSSSISGPYAAQIRFARVDSKYDKSGQLLHHAQSARTTPGKRAQHPKKQFINSRIRQAVIDPDIVMVAQFGALSSNDWISVRSQVNKLDYSITVLPNIQTKRLLETTRYVNLSPLFWSTTCVVSGSDPTKLKNIMGLMKSPKFEIMGGRIGTKLLSFEQFQEASKLPGLDVLQATVVSLLSQPASKVHSLLQSSQSDLVEALRRHADPPTKTDE